jgi:hypothetical protein
MSSVLAVSAPARRAQLAIAPSGSNRGQPVAEVPALDGGCCRKLQPAVCSLARSTRYRVSASPTAKMLIGGCLQAKGNPIVEPHE